LYTPVTKNDFYNVLTNAWDNNQAFVMYNYDFGAGSEYMRAVQENLYSGFQLAGISHPELSSGLYMLAVAKDNGKGCVLEVRFESEDKDKGFDGLMEEKLQAEMLAESIIEEMFDGSEAPEIKADTIHDYVVESFEYDYSFGELSYSAYGALKNNKAVCQGYSAAFNLLCKAAGVKALAVANDEHMWNAVLIDGTVLFYDTTYDDTGSDPERYKGVERHSLILGGLHNDYFVPEMEFFV
ncbi:MAG: hypothetical protein IJZ20_04215, partial [Clostridia bacterium]|nr:hypothetical protein [Clostridia bacterium]